MEAIKAILIPSYNRTDLCKTCIKSIVKQNTDIPIFVTVERDQYNKYVKAVGKYAKVIPLAKKRLGVSYSIHYGLKYLAYKGYDLVLRTDDDVRLGFDIKKFFRKKEMYSSVPWIGSWFSIYDFFYKDKEVPIRNNSNIIEAVSSLYSRCYIIDLNYIESIGNWDWRYRYWDDYDMVTRIINSGKKIAVYKKALAGSLAVRASSGGVKASIKDVDVVAKNNMKLLVSKFGEKIAKYRINEAGKVFIRYNWRYVKSRTIKLRNNNFESMFNTKIAKKIDHLIKKQAKL